MFKGHAFLRDMHFGTIIASAGNDRIDESRLHHKRRKAFDGISDHNR